MIDSIFKLRYITHGLYEWGKGYVNNDVAAKWRKFFNEFDDCRWTVIKPNSSGDCFRIASTYSCCYLHPMGGLLTLHNKNEVDRVKVFITNAVKRCGGHVDFREQRVSFKLEV